MESKQLSFIERMQEAASKRSDNMTTLTDDQKTIIRNIKTLKEHILEGYVEKMQIANSRVCNVNGHEYAQHYAVIWDSAIETNPSITDIDIDKIMSNRYTSELPEGHRYNKSFLSILQSGLPPDHKIYISCKYVVYMFWKMDMFADRLYQYCSSNDHIGKCIIHAIKRDLGYASIWSMKRNANIIPELNGSDIDALLRHGYRTSANDMKLTVVQRLQALLDTDKYNNGYDSSTGNKLVVKAIYGMPPSRNPYQIVVWRRNNLNPDK